MRRLTHAVDRDFHLGIKTECSRVLDVSNHAASKVVQEPR